MAQEPYFQRVQREFCAHVRDPRNVAPPEGIEDRRMAIYRRLFFSNIHGLVEGMFPRTLELVGAKALKEACYEFFSHYACRTPYFHQIDSEFVDYLAKEKPAALQDFPYAPELADYECTWRKVNLADDAPLAEPPAKPNEDNDLLDHCLLLSPSLQLRVYAWPVHQITERPPSPSKPEIPTPLLIFRNRKKHIQVVELDLPSARLLLGLQTQPEHNACKHLEIMLAESDQAPRPAINNGARDMLVSLYQQGAVLGLAAAP